MSLFSPEDGELGSCGPPSWGRVSWRWEVTTNGEAFQAETLGGTSEQDACGDARLGLFPQPAGLFGVVMFQHGTTEIQAPARWFMGC